MTRADETATAAHPRNARSGRGVCLAALVLALACLAAPRGAAGFDLEDVAAKARSLAAQPYRDTRGEVPDWLLKIDYDQWRDIRFRPDHALWKKSGLRFQVQFFHPGLYYDHVVAINVVSREGVQPVEFSTDQFDYGKNAFAGRVPSHLGYAGFRVHYPLNRPDYYDELIVFLGASYFRALAAHEVYGISARGIAIDTIGPSPEEFPYFREFWLVRPDAGAKRMTIYALLDGKSVTGAYRFVVTPGDQTTVAVDMRIFLRHAVNKLGIAPLTSMFFHGENTLRPIVDYRPEVHDSDGLLLHFSTGEWLWRPLENPSSLQVNSFQMKSPHGFGLLQRDRDFEHYQDLETRTELRPSVWIDTRGDWGPGAVELVELPTDTDIHDNIVSYWTPRRQPDPGEAASFSYTMSWYGDDPSRPPGGRVVATRRDFGTLPNARRFVLDFQGGALQALGADQPPHGVVTGTDDAEILDEHIVKNPVTRGWRLAFQVRPKKKAPVELRAFLERDGKTLTETWSYALLPE
jgi:glucans biosynthesis protein